MGLTIILLIITQLYMSDRVTTLFLCYALAKLKVTVVASILVFCFDLESIGKASLMVLSWRSFNSSWPMTLKSGGTALPLSLPSDLDKSNDSFNCFFFALHLTSEESTALQTATMLLSFSINVTKMGECATGRRGVAGAMIGVNSTAVAGSVALTMVTIKLKAMYIILSNVLLVATYLLLMEGSWISNEYEDADSP